MTSPDFNPHVPGRKGIELADVGVAQTVINSPSAQAWLRFLAKSSHAVTDWQLHAGIGASAGLLDDRYNGLRRPMMLDLVLAGNEPFGTVIQDDFNVSSITGGPGMFNENLTTPLTTTRLSGTNDGFFVVASTLGAAFNANFGTSAYPLDRQILGIKINMRINITTGLRRIDPGGVADSPWSYDVPWWTSTTQPVTLLWGEAIVEGNSGTAWKHWTPQMIRELATTRGLRVACLAGAGYWRIDRLYISVYSIPERRVGVGIGSPSSEVTWINFDMTTPNATGAPALVSGQEYALVARRMADYSVDNVANVTMPWRLIRGRGPDGDWRRYGAAGDLREGILSARSLNGATFQAESQPYDLTRGANVYDGQTASQFLTMAGDATIYGQAYIVAGWNPTTGRPAEPLRAEVYRVADGVRVLSPVEITADEVDQLPTSAPFSFTDDLGRTFKTVKLRFPESVTLSAGSHELRISSPGTTSGRPWNVAAAIGGWDARTVTYGGATDYADGEWTSAGAPRELTSTNDRSSDLLAQLVTVPAAVTGVGTSVGSLTAHHLELCDPNVGCDGCADDTMPYVQVTWSPAPSGTPDIEAYEIDRLVKGEWRRVALVWGRLSDAWNDLEAPIGALQYYRVRVVNVDGVTGDWSAEVTAMIPLGQVALSLSSNAATGMGCVYPEVWPNEAQRGFEFQEAGDVTYGSMYGRDGQVAFRPIERRGDAFERELLLSALCSVPLPSMTVFDPLRDLAWSPIPYVCIRDGEGNSWNVSLEVPEGNNRRADASGSDLWTVSIRAVQTTFVPAVHDTSVPQVTGPVRLPS